VLSDKTAAETGGVNSGDILQIQPAFTPVAVAVVQ